MNSASRRRLAGRIAALLLMIATPALAVDVFVRSLNSIDISAFQSCHWGEGRPAPDHQVEQQIRRSIEEHLTRAGYSMVPEGGDCRVTSRAVGDANFPVGVLMIELHEVSSGRIAWRGEASGLVEGTTKERVKKVRKLLKKMFKHFPPAAG